MLIVESAPMIHSVLIFILVFGLRFGGVEQGADCGACSHIRILFQIFILFLVRGLGRVPIVEPDLLNHLVFKFRFRLFV